MRDLLLPAVPIKGTGAALFANIDYDAKLAPPLAALGAAALPLEAFQKPFPKLAVAKRYVELLAAKLKSLVDGEVQFHEAGKATKEAFLRVRSPPVLMLVTHGYFLRDEALDMLAEFGGLAEKRAAKTATNPLLRGGLALSGANHRGPGIGPEAGIVTALEIAGMDLRGTELVVLSACDAGVGSVQLGEGIAGLRQAFLLAGADSVVATLWKIPASDSSVVMADFWTRLQKGEDRCAALCGAQRDTIARLRGDRGDKLGQPHPYLWAGFTLTGQVSETSNASTAVREQRP